MSSRPGEKSVRVRFSITVLVCLFLVMPRVSAQVPESDDSYENHNQVDYGPLKVSKLRGVAVDPGDGPVPQTLVLLFTEKGHKLVAKTLADKSGHFHIKYARKGRYRLVAKAYGLCTANVPIIVSAGSTDKNGTHLLLHMEPGGIDSCSYGEVKR